MQSCETTLPVFPFLGYTVNQTLHTCPSSRTISPKTTCLRSRCFAWRRRTRPEIEKMAKKMWKNCFSILSILDMNHFKQPAGLSWKVLVKHFVFNQVDARKKSSRELQISINAKFCLSEEDEELWVIPQTLANGSFTLASRHENATQEAQWLNSRNSIPKLRVGTTVGHG